MSMEHEANKYERSAMGYLIQRFSIKTQSYQQCFHMPNNLPSLFLKLCLPSMLPYFGTSCQR